LSILVKVSVHDFILFSTVFTMLDTLSYNVSSTQVTHAIERDYFLFSTIPLKLGMRTGIACASACGFPTRRVRNVTVMQINDLRWWPQNDLLKMLHGSSLLPFREGHAASDVDVAVRFSLRWRGPTPRSAGLLRIRISSVFWKMQSRHSDWC
jgi:hypothetical protein